VKRIKKSAAIATMATLGALLVPGAAYAAQWNPMEAYTNTDCSWALSGTVRNKTDYGNMSFTPNNLPSGGLVLRLYNSNNGTYFTSGTTFTSMVNQTLATGVVAGTRFQVGHRKTDCAGSDRFWSGSMYY
jgi:hypothetical protein